MNHQVSNRCRLGNVARVVVPVLIDPTASNDGDGKPLDSANKYVMHYDKSTLQPANASWSISHYKRNFYAENALSRYVIAPLCGSRSIRTFICRPNRPGADRESN